MLKLPEGNDLFGVAPDIYVRDSYRELYEIIHHRAGKGKHIIITGNPGIGKSCFLLYNMYRLRKEDKYLRLVYTSARYSLHVLLCRGSVRVYTTEEMLGITRDLKQLIYLYDCGTKGDPLPVSPPMLSRKTIIATSPDECHTKSFVKETTAVKPTGSPTLLTLYMPPWSLDELEDFRVRAQIPTSKKELIDHYTTWGGIPRYMFFENIPKSKLDQAIVDVDPDDIMSIPSMLYRGVVKSEVSHKLFQLHPRDDSEYQEADVHFASGYVQKVVYETHTKYCRGIVCSIINSSRTFNSFQGDLFEQMAHGELAHGGVWKAYSLPGRNASSLDLGEPKVQFFRDIADLHQYKITGAATYSEQLYLRPEPKNFKSLDSILLQKGTTRAIGFQITIASKHSIHRNGLQDIRRALCNTENDPFEIYFVVPSIVQSSFTKQQNYVGTNKNVLSSGLPEHVDQFVVGMDFH